MRRKMLCLAIILAVMFMGCEKSTDLAENPEYAAVDSTGEKREDTKESAGGKTGTPKNKQTDGTSYRLDGSLQRVIQLYQVKGKKNILAWNDKDQLILYKMEDDKMSTYQFKSAKGKSVTSCRILSYQEDIILFTEMAKVKSERIETEVGPMETSTSSKEEQWLYVFDKNLTLKEKKNITQLAMKMSETSALCLNGEVGYIALDDGGIYHYSLKKGKGKRLSQKIIKSLKDITIDEMQISEKQDKIAFLGCEFGQDKYDVYGWIDLQKETVEWKYTETPYGNTLHLQKDTAYITDGEIPLKQMATGIVKCIDLPTGKFYDFPVDNLESTDACLSEDCSCLFTKSEILSDNNEKVVGYLLRIYDFSNGKILYEKKWKDKGDIVRVFPVGEGFYVVTYRDGEKELHFITV